MSFEIGVLKSFRIWSEKHGIFQYFLVDDNLDLFLRREAEKEIVLDFSGFFDCKNAMIYEGDFIILIADCGSIWEVVLKNGKFCLQEKSGVFEPIESFCKKNENVLQDGFFLFGNVIENFRT